MALATDSPWPAIVSAALIGTERQPFQLPIASGKLGQVLAQLTHQLTHQSAEAALLAAAATIALHQRVGWLPETQSVLSSEPCPSSDLPQCSPLAARCLQEILQGQYPSLLREWLDKAAIAGQRVPDMLLPTLLDKGRQQREWRAAMLPVLGQRGRWLAAQNPDWSYAVVLATEADWETGTPAARLMVLQELRSRDPDRARELLQTTWSQEAASDRVNFLESLRVGLSLADEPFLEAALGDRRSKEVRRVAVDLLASLPESRFCQQITEQTCRYVSMDCRKPPSLNVQLPDRLDETLMQLGFEPKPSAVVEARLGEKAWWLLQMIGATPLSVWTDRGQMSPSAILALAQASDWQTVMLNGLALAAKRQKHEGWLEAILRLWVVGQGAVREAEWIDLRIEDLWNTLSADRRDRLLIDRLQASHSTIQESLTIRLLRSSSQPWSLTLARLVLEALEHHVNTTTTLSNLNWELRATLKEFARLIPVRLTSDILQWRTQLKQDSPWSRSVDECLAVLQFRQEMTQAFEIKDGG